MCAFDEECLVLLLSVGINNNKNSYNISLKWSLRKSSLSFYSWFCPNMDGWWQFFISLQFRSHQNITNIAAVHFCCAIRVDNERSEFVFRMSWIKTLETTLQYFPCTPGSVVSTLRKIHKKFDFFRLLATDGEWKISEYGFGGFRPRHKWVRLSTGRLKKTPRAIVDSSTVTSATKIQQDASGSEWRAVYICTNFSEKFNSSIRSLDLTLFSTKM